MVNSKTNLNIQPSLRLVTSKLLETYTAIVVMHNVINHRYKTFVVFYTTLLLSNQASAS